MTSSSAEPSPYRVLYVNDDSAFGNLVRTKLERADADIRLELAASTEEALECLEETPIECVVTAYALGEDTGLDLTRDVRATHPALPIVLFTGQGSETIAGEATQAGVSDYMPVQSDRNNFELLARRIGTLVDAERKQRAGRRSTERFRRTLERTTDAVYAVDQEWRIEYMNERMAARVDRDADAVVGRRLWDVFPSVEDTELGALYREAMATGDPVATEQWLGEPFEYWVSVRAFPDDDGLTVFSQDVTAERERRMELEQAERIIENVDDMVLVLDPDQEVRFANAPAVRAMVGGERDDVVGESLFDLVSGTTEGLLRTQFSDALDDVLSEALDAGAATTDEGVDHRETLESPAGDWTLEVSLSSLATEEGPRVVVVARDVTERAAARRQAEQERDALRRVQSAIAADGVTHDERLAAVVDAGRDALGADAAVLSTTGGEVVATATEPAHGEGVSEALLEADLTGFDADTPRDTVVTAGAGDGDVRHVAPDRAGVDSYVACPVFADGDLYGRLAFASDSPGHAEFGESQVTVVSLLAQWVGSELDRERSRERAEASRKRTRQIIDMLPQLVFAKDESGTFVLANEAMAAAYGTTVDELEGMTDADFAESAAEAEAFREDDRAVIESGEPKHVPEEPLTTADGERRLFQTTKIPYQPVGSDEQAVLGVSSDITDLKSYEAELELQAAAMEASMDGIAILEDGEYVYMNEAHADVFDYDASDLLGRNWRYVYHDDEVERIETTVFETLDADGEWRGEAVGKRKDGSTVRQEITLSMFEDGKLICTNRDISGRKAREQEIRELKERLDLAVEGADIGIWDWNVATGEVVFNDQWAEMLGHSLDEIEPSVDAWEKRVNPEDLPAVEERWEAHMAGETDLYDTEHRIRAKDGDWVWVRDIGRIVERDESGDPKRAVGIHLDITERKHLEDSLRRNAQSLRQLYEVTADTESSFEDKLDRVMALSADHLGVDYSFMTRIEDGTQRVVQSYGDKEALQAGSSAPLSEAYCRRTIEQDSLVAMADSVEAGWEDDPAYERFGLGCYVGGKLEVDGTVVGTLCWADDASRAPSFSEAEQTFVELVVQWVTYELERERIEERLRRLQTVTSELMQLQSIDEIGATAVEAAADVLDLDVTGIWAYDEERDVLSPIAQSADATDVTDDVPVFERGVGLAWEAFESGEMRHYDDVSAVDGRYNEETPLKSEIQVPLGDYGLMSTGSTAAGQFSESDVDLFRILASSVESAMRRSEREAELREQNERLDEFASVVAHDVRNPLTVAMGMVEAARDTGDLAYLDEVAASHDRIQRIIEDLLALTRSGNEVEDPSAMDLEVVATEAWGYVDTTDGAIHLEESLPVVSGDKSRVIRLFENLFRNAIEHNDDPVEVTVGATEDGFFVADDGAGIPSEDRASVFEHGKTTNEDGTGLGLSIVEDIAGAHGWTVEVEEGADGGARFVLDTGGD
jgi:PAS domain S-box-containing protein